MKLAFIFPGQGSQSVGMMQGFADTQIVRETFEEASSILGQDFWRLVCEGPAESLNSTVITQPLMLTAGVAAWRAWQAQTDIRPALMAGHSLGEYTALVASGALTFKAALPLVRYRAEIMQAAVAEGQGGMAAVLGLEDADVIALCADAAQGEVLEAVNFNSPAQVVIAGTRTAVERGIELAKAGGAKRALLLSVSVPSHCALMRPAAEKLEQYLKDVSFQAPQTPVLHNADVAVATGVADIATALVKQLDHPVRWVETIRRMAGEGVTNVVECGPGKVLVGLNKRIEPTMHTFALIDPPSLTQTINALA